MLGIAVLPSVIIAFGVIVIPESPCRLIGCRELLEQAIVGYCHVYNCCLSGCVVFLYQTLAHNLGLLLRDISFEDPCTGIGLGYLGEPVGEWGCGDADFNIYRGDQIWRGVFSAFGNNGGGYIHFYFFLPETKGRALEEMVKIFERGDERLRS